MKATGIIRRLDDLGRIVIPKEIRKQMNINAGDPMEIYVDGNMVCFGKYTSIDQEHWNSAIRIANVMLNGFKFVLLDRYGDVIDTNSKDAVTIDTTEGHIIEIRVNNEIEGYIQALEKNAPIEKFAETAKVISALFTEG